MIHKNIAELIGNTPLVEISGLEGQKARIAVKLESFNPGGSVKDRIALAMIEDAEERGVLAPGATIIEPTVFPLSARRGGFAQLLRPALIPTAILQFPISGDIFGIQSQK